MWKGGQLTRQALTERNPHETEAPMQGNVRSRYANEAVRLHVGLVAEEAHKGGLSQFARGLQSSQGRHWQGEARAGAAKDRK